MNKLDWLEEVSKLKRTDTTENTLRIGIYKTDRAGQSTIHWSYFEKPAEVHIHTLSVTSNNRINLRDKESIEIQRTICTTCGEIQTNEAGY
jgi:hypothetical protein